MRSLVPAYPLSLRSLQEMMAERGVLIDQAMAHHWVLKMLPVLAAVYRRCGIPVGSSWWVDKIEVRVGGRWKYLYSAGDTFGWTVDFLLTAYRDVTAARSPLEHAIDLRDVPASITRPAET